MRVRITPYGPSNSARDLCAAINERTELLGLPTVLRTRQRDSQYYMKDGDMVINWGMRLGRRSRMMGINAYVPSVYNLPYRVEGASNKLKTFECLHSARIPIPSFTSNKLDAERAFHTGDTIVVRATLSGHGGTGISIVTPNSVESLPEAPLYTKYIPKEHEYRVHVLGEETHIRQKRRKLSHEDPNWQIRNHANGFVMAQECSFIPEGIEALSIAAVDALNLHFGAVDIIYGTDGKCYVLEVNTAPGLEASTLALYADYFVNEIKGAAL